MKKLISFGVATLLTGAFAGNAIADQKCKSVDIKVTNSYGKNIKVVNVFYYDIEDKKWRDDNVSDKVINNGKSHTFDRGLEYVGNEKITQWQVKFRYKEADGDWSDKVCSNVITNQSKASCVKNKDYTLKVSSKSSCKK
jgi:hypothetical protein